MKVLIVSELFEPLNRIGSIRPSKLAKMLSKSGYEVDVFTSYKTKVDKEYNPQGFRIIYDKTKSYSSNNRNVVTSNRKVIKFNRQSKIIRELSGFYRQIRVLKEGIEFKDNFFKTVEKGIINISDYDCIFTTFGPVGTILIGIETKRTHPNIKWINDFRDPMISKVMPKLIYPYYSYLQKKSIELCDYVTTVSNGYKKRMSSPTTEPKFRVIPNGYDKDDRIIFKDSYVEDIFSFVYTGSLYEGKRKIEPLFNQIKRLCKEEILTMEDISFHYAGNDFNYLYKQAKMYNLDKVLINHGFLSREKCMKLQAISRFSVISTWNEEGEEGVFPGKFIESMLIGHPIIALVDGNKANSEVTEIIRKYGLGVSYEKANPDTEEELYQWLKRKAIQFKKNKTGIFKPSLNAIDDMFSWESNVTKFEVLINE